MNEIFKLFGSVGLHTDEAESGLDSVRSKGEETSNGLVSFFKKAAVGIAAVFAAGKIIDFGKDVTESAADAQAIRGQYEQVFGNMTGQADNMAAKMAGTFGMIPEQLTPGMIKFQSMFRGVGIDTAKAMDMTTQATTAAADASKFANVSYADAQASIQSFILGNYEAGDAIGVQANDNAVAQYAIQQGAAKTTAEWQKMGDAQKEQMRLGFITHVQELSGVTGQAARESGSYEAVTERLSATWEKFKATIGAPVLAAVIPVLNAVANGLGNLDNWVKSVIGDGQQMGSMFSGVAGLVGGAFDIIVRAVMGAIDWVKQFFNSMKQTGAIDALKQTFSAVQIVVGTVIDIFKIFWNTLTAGAPSGKQTTDGLANGIKGIANWLTNAVNNLGAFLTELANSGQVQAFANIIKGAVGQIQNFVNWIKKGGSEVDQFKAILVGVGTGFAVFKVGQAALQAWQTATKVATAVQAAYNAVMNANPIMAIVTLLGVLVGALVYFFTQTKTGQKVWQDIMDFMHNSMQAISSFFSGVWKDITGFFNSAGDAISNKWNGLLNWFRGIPNSISNFFSGIGSSIGSHFQQAAQSIRDTFDSVVNFVRNIPSQIMGFFSNMSISLPHIDLPHFSLKGDFNPLKGQIPSLGIEWYAKGGIMQSPTMFGMNGNNAMVGGEAGKEAVLPLNKENLGAIGAGIAETMTGSDNSDIIEAINAMARRIVEAVLANKDVYFDGQALTDRVENLLMKGVTT